jgi:methyl-accepting chemotaxis protein PixJ
MKNLLRKSIFQRGLLEKEKYIISRRREKNIMQSSSVRTELLLASILPTAAILFVGVVGIEQMQGMDIRFFLAVLLASASAIFCAEYALIRFMQNTTGRQIDELVLACREYLSGNYQRRPEIYGDNALSILAHTLHLLLDASPQNVQPQPPHPNVYPDTEKNSVLAQQLDEQNLAVIQQLDTQMQKLIGEIIPVTKGDLRVRAEIPQGNLGIIADLFNAFIEEVIDLVRWIRYSATHLTGSTSILVSCSIDLAQTAETQLLHFSQTTKTVETLTAELENFRNALQTSVKTVRKIRTYVSQHASDATLEKSALLQRLETDTKLQEQLLGEVLNSAESNITLTKSLIFDFHAFAKHMYESSTGVLQATERLQAVSKLAEQWYNTVIAFQLPVEVEKKIVQDTSVSASNTSPIPIASTQKMNGSRASSI